MNFGFILVLKKISYQKVNLFKFILLFNSLKFIFILGLFVLFQMILKDVVFFFILILKEFYLKMRKLYLFSFENLI